MDDIFKVKLVKFFGVFFIALAVLNFIFFMFRMVNVVQFWFIIIICAVMAYWGVPFMRKSLLGEKVDYGKNNSKKSIDVKRKE